MTPAERCVVLAVARRCHEQAYPVAVLDAARACGVEKDRVRDLHRRYLTKV